MAQRLTYVCRHVGCSRRRLTQPRGHLMTDVRSCIHHDELRLATAWLARSRANPVGKAGLPPALTGTRRHVNCASTGIVSYYTAGPDSLVDGAEADPPLLLIHSVSAAASAYEMKPLYEYFRTRRPVYAIDLPGFGFSERDDIEYSPSIMTNAIHVLVAEIASRHGAVQIDAMALSLSSEFLARAVAEAPKAFRSLALISPTSFGTQHRRHDCKPESSRELKFMRWLVSFRPLGQVLFSALSRPRTIRYVSERTWGSRRIDEGLWHYSTFTAAQPGARYAPLRFVALALLSEDISCVYEALELPVWMSRGVRGHFTVYRGEKPIEKRRNWHINVFQTGAMPHFEMRQHFISAYKLFLRQHALRVRPVADATGSGTHGASIAGPKVNQYGASCLASLSQAGC